MSDSKLSNQIQMYYKQPKYKHRIQTDTGRDWRTFQGETGSIWRRGGDEVIRTQTLIAYLVLQK